MLKIVCTFVAVGDGGEDEEQHPACGRSVDRLSLFSISYPRKRISLSSWLDYLTDPFQSDGCIETIELRLQ